MVQRTDLQSREARKYPKKRVSFLPIRIGGTKALPTLNLVGQSFSHWVFVYFVSLMILYYLYLKAASLHSEAAKCYVRRSETANPPSPRGPRINRFARRNYRLGLRLGRWRLRIASFRHAHRQKQCGQSRSAVKSPFGPIGQCG